MKRVEIPSSNKASIVRTERIEVKLPSQPIRYFRHGWQSWSLAAWTDLNPLPLQKPGILRPLQVDIEYADEKNPHGSWLGAVEFEDGNVLLLGALGLDAHVRLAGDQLSGWSEAGEIEWFVAFGNERAIFAEYARELGVRFGKTMKARSPRVWCSWYSLYYMIDEAIMFRVFDELGDLPFDVLQVDDGWQAAVGDWGANSRFPSGMNALADRIRSTGRKAGLWLAPLVAVESSPLFREHQDWFLRDERGRLVSAGFNWGEQLYALDTTHPAVTEYLVSLMRQVRAWGFDYLKLDFLYAGALKGTRYKDIPREAAYRECLKILREAMGTDAFLLTCGTPILPALGLCDAMRIGPDVADEWENHRDAYLFSNPTTPGIRNAVRTVAQRLWLNGLVHPDPDVAYFTEMENALTQEEKTLLQDLALICDFRATSDLPQWLTEAEREQLRAFLTANPAITQVDRYLFDVGGRRVDFAPAAGLPEPPRGLTALKAALLGWLADVPLVLKIYKRTEDRRLKIRRESL